MRFEISKIHRNIKFKTLFLHFTSRARFWAVYLDSIAGDTDEPHSPRERTKGTKATSKFARRFHSLNRNETSF